MKLCEKKCEPRGFLGTTFAKIATAKECIFIEEAIAFVPFIIKIHFLGDDF